MDKKLFEQRVLALWPAATIHKIVSINTDNHIAVVQLNENRPFFVGLRYGHPVPIMTATVRETHQYFNEIANELNGLMALMHVLMIPHEPARDWTAINKLLGINPTD